MRYWDSSAVVPLLLEESSRSRMMALIEADPLMVVWWGTPVECASAIARREREGSLSVAGATQAMERLRALEPSWNEVVPSTAVRTTAERLLRVHSLRAADALQLAAAIVAAAGEPSWLGFVCLDERLSEAAQREGFHTVDG